jgi:hypothetical protein
MWSKNGPFVVPPRVIIDYDDVVGIDVDQSAADVAIFDIPCNGTILFSALLCTEAITAATTAPVIKLDIRPTAGSDTNRGDGDAGAITLPSGTAIGSVIYDEAGKGEQVSAGDQVVCQYATAASGPSITGHFVPILVIDPEWEMLGNLTGWTETA